MRGAALAWFAQRWRIVVPAPGVLILGMLILMSLGREELPSHTQTAEQRVREQTEWGAGERPRPKVTDAGVVAPHCDNPFVPSAVGAVREYRMRSAAVEQQARLTFEVIGRSWRGDVVEVHVRQSIHTSEGANTSTERTIRCTPGVDAEEPWFGMVGALLQRRDRPDRWRWPAALGPGVTFEGTDVRGLDDPTAERVLTIHRSHAVIERETVTVAAGRFEAWRVDYVESTRYGKRANASEGSTWVSERVGMVRTVGRSGDASVHMELTEAVDPVPVASYGERSEPSPVP